MNIFARQFLVYREKIELFLPLCKNLKMWKKNLKISSSSLSPFKIFHLEKEFFFSKTKINQKIPEMIYKKTKD